MNKNKTIPGKQRPPCQMKKTCDICHGSGQLSSFKGVSRFLLSWEECPECGGLGYIITRDSGTATQAGDHDHDEKDSGKKTTRPKGRK